jgi:hypothetical protein
MRNKKNKLPEYCASPPARKEFGCDGCALANGKLDCKGNSFGNRRYADVELLLRRWKELDGFADKAITTQREADVELSEEELHNLMVNPYWNPDYEADTLTRHKQWTVIAVTHIRRQLEEWINDGDRASLIRRKIIQGLYIDEQRTTLKELSGKEHIPIERLSRELAAAKEQLTARIFGAAGLLKQEPGGSHLRT